MQLLERLVFNEDGVNKIYFSTVAFGATVALTTSFDAFTAWTPWTLNSDLVMASVTIWEFPNKTGAQLVSNRLCTWTTQCHNIQTHGHIWKKSYVIHAKAAKLKTW